MNDNTDLKFQTNSNTQRLDAFNASQTIPLNVDQAWQNRGFLKENFFVTGQGEIAVNGQYIQAIPGSNRYSVVLLAPIIGSSQMWAQMRQSHALNNFGSSTSQFDITNPAGDIFRYTWDGNGTNPNISATTLPVGSFVYVFGQNFNVANNNSAVNPVFVVVGSGANYFEVGNATPGVVESNKTLGTGSITGGPPIDTYEIIVEGTYQDQFTYVVLLFKSQPFTSIV